MRRWLARRLARHLDPQVIEVTIVDATRRRAYFTITSPTTPEWWDRGSVAADGGKITITVPPEQP